MRGIGIRRIALVLPVVAGLHLLQNDALASTLYAASGAGGVGGSLYTLDSSTGAATLVGALLDALGRPYGVTGLAFDPFGGTLYASIANASPNGAGHLASVNSATGQVTDIGSFGISGTLSDLGFTSDGTLYGWGASQHFLFTVNVATGAATKVGSPPSFPGFGGGGLAPDASNTIWITPDGATNPPGTIRTVDRTTGAVSAGVFMSGAPLGGIINSMVFDGSILYGINANQAGLSHLVTINPSSGVVSDIGQSANALDAIAVAGSAAPEPSTLLLLGAGAAVVFYRRRR